MRRAVVDEEKDVPAFSGKFTVQSTHPVFKKSIVVALSERSMFELTTLMLGRSNYQVFSAIKLDIILPGPQRLFE